MPTRSEIRDALAESQEQVFAYFDGLSQEALERPCTASGVPGEAPWRAKDHFAHLTANEQNIQTLLRILLTGQSRGKGPGQRKRPRTTSTQPLSLQLTILTSDSWWNYRLEKAI